jgi:hypothetical protein
VSGAEAIPLWRRLREAVPRTGHWPVLLGEPQDLDFHREGITDINPTEPQDTVRQAEQMDAGLLLRKRQAILEPDDLEENGTDEGGDYEPPHGYWPEGDHANDGYYIPYHYRTKEPLSEVFIGLVPTPGGWEAPAFLGFGGWNDCPPPAEHVCMMKSWHERYGAEVVGITHDIVEMAVARPPTTREAALRLAEEHYAYCYDIVDQGTQTIEGLAATLLNGTVWFFWWD